MENKDKDLSFWDKAFIIAVCTLALLGAGYSVGVGIGIFLGFFN